ncbi:MAG: cell division protein ZapA [Alphaproteobacteria bacterium]|nr:cell division protein ZapA [Alphaproteobacteria bacterium]
MADVQLSVGGQRYTVSCGEGQEENLKSLAHQLDEKVSFIKSRMPVNEGLGLVMGALLLASDLTEKNQELSAAQVENAASAEVLAQTTQLIEKVTQRISAVAETIENA